MDYNLIIFALFIFGIIGFIMGYTYHKYFMSDSCKLTILRNKKYKEMRNNDNNR